MIGITTRARIMSATSEPSTISPILTPFFIFLCNDVVSYKPI